MVITDPILSVIVEASSTGGLPPTTAKAVHHLAHLLLAAHTLDDVSVFAAPLAWGDGRHIAPVMGKWGISFVMSGNGPDDLHLEKLPKSWPVKQNHSSRPRRREKS